MNKTDQHQKGVIGIIERAKKYNPAIGSYAEHFITERFTFLARLLNGRIEIPMDMADIQETIPSNISEEGIKRVASTFQNNNLIRLSTKPIVKKSSVWQRFLEFFGFSKQV
jgi:hypothetical protein